MHINKLWRTSHKVLHNTLIITVIMQHTSIQNTQFLRNIPTGRNIHGTNNKIEQFKHDHTIAPITNVIAAVTCILLSFDSKLGAVPTNPKEDAVINDTHCQGLPSDNSKNPNVNVYAQISIVMVNQIPPP